MASDLEQRFAYLLQPIRDLTKNWNVDISSELENYLGEIDSITISFDGGKTVLNFAEAALLIQGTASVYSKKVEYLHALVYQVLELLANKKKLQKEAEGAEGANETRRVRQEDDDEFLTLDDIKDTKNIDMKHDGDDNDKTTQVLPKVTLSLIPLTDGEKGENPLISHKGEILGSRNDFKMNTCNIHPTGILLLDLSHLDLLDLSIQNKPCSTPFVPRIAALTEGLIPADIPPPMDIMEDEGLPLDISMEDNVEGFEAPMDADVAEPEEPIPQELHREGLRPRPEKNKNIIRQTRTDVDPWIVLDAHEAGPGEKVFKKKKTYKIPPSLVQETNKKRKRKSNDLNKGQERLKSLSEFCNEAFYSNASKFPRNPLKVPLFMDFEELYWEEFKRRQQKLKKQRKQMKAQGQIEELAEELAQEQEEEDQFGLPVADDDNDDNDAADFQVPIDIDLGPMDPGLLDQDPPEDPELELEDIHVITSYEELVKRHVEGYLASAQQYAQITELSRRVTEWEEKILPKLQNEETRKEFDIHKYGSEVIHSVEDASKKNPENHEIEPGQKILFQRVCRNKEPWEVCRLFLSTLQLANAYNVEISSEGCLEKSIDTMSVKLLSARRHFEELEEYRAPSFDK